MSKSLAVITVHPDDETLGAGGWLPILHAQGWDLHWVILTEMDPALYAQAALEKRAWQIQQIQDFFKFKSVHRLGLPTAQLERFSYGELISKLSAVLNHIQPHTVLIPHISDVHSDHRIVFEVMQACTKPFRYPFIRRVIAMETLSETGVGFDLAMGRTFVPNLFVDISDTLEKKLKALALYDTEIAPPPFPRNAETISALARYRGSQANMHYAEAFMILRQFES